MRVVCEAVRSLKSYLQTQNLVCEGGPTPPPDFESANTLNRTERTDSPDGCGKVSIFIPNITARAYTPLVTAPWLSSSLSSVSCSDDQRWLFKSHVAPSVASWHCEPALVENIAQGRRELLQG
ncbi:hypothetical protein PsYK624_098950 [Phanerochaete sordida]|uniref:Uncharacterized protein n=1 Tax=Phanerochaete sordida TaxID=48140 RepID=A0A9P3GG86_9APHY|nr:hypothetical protein PsYK624_098950 [Phanerochaete sordida]